MMTTLPLGGDHASLASDPSAETPPTVHERPQRMLAARLKQTARRPTDSAFPTERPGERHISEILPGVLARYLVRMGRDAETERRRE
jgi:hypothetical protein